MDRKELNKKAILLVGVLQYQVDLLEELMEHRVLSSVFTHQLKMHSKGVIKQSDKILNALCSAERDQKFTQEVQNIYEAVSELIENLNWEHEKTTND